MKVTAVAISAAALFAQGAYSWGLVGHATVAYVAQNYMNGAARILTSHLLSGTPLAEIASWADTFRTTPDGRFSAVLHYIDANDKPPQKCNVKMERDCASEGCIVTAIANYTSRILDDTLDFSERSDALKFIVHFFGDISQPLHTEGLAVGGNEISVLWGNLTTGAKVNLHAAWDRQFVDTLAGGNTLAAANSLAKNIIADLDTGIYKDLKAGWTSCGSIKRGTGCPKAWAQDSNRLICSNVLANGVEEVEGKDISGDYYAANVPIVRQQLAKGGYRLGLWLNAIAKAEQLKCSSRP
ncbi:hypothetical protein DRE_01146 [Drechslerella stenobrocha 248]|uniref:Nuclease S1 n=1 Tax=Drechslerella stenobrocha 248 TaxID=1043628 RepID=W7I6B8_9PEZI|nr:hypothetical protein DRE_01146 [Drechslerella stenobrocha 248]